VGEPLKARLTAVEDTLIQTRMRGESDRLNYPSTLNADLVQLAAVVASADSVPTQPSYEVFAGLSARVEARVQELAQIVATDVAAFEHLVREAGVPAISPTAV
jgi:hypothetical protein